MKHRKFISFVLCAALAFSAAGCTAAPTPTTVTTQPTTEETTAETTLESTTTSFIDPSVTYHAPMAAVSLPVVTQSSKASDGTTLFSYTYQNMTLFLQDAPVADAVILDFLNRMDDFHTSAKQLQSEAASAYTGQTDWESYSFSLLYQPMRFDAMVLSLMGTESIFDGYDRNNSANLSITYDLLTGNALGIRDILVADYSAEKLVELIIDGLSQYEKDELLFPDYKELISDMFFTNRPAENWYLAQDGLYFYFSPYEVGPYSSGTLVSKIPYDALGGLLKDSYFPAESVVFSGTPVITVGSTTEAADIGHFAELVIEEGGKENLLYADGTILNVRIESGFWSSDGSFTPNATIFAATSISKGDGVMILCDDLSHYLLTYETMGQVVTVPLK